MGILKLKEETLGKKSLIIKEALDHFASRERFYSKEIIDEIAAASENAFSDEILFEEFENWASEKDDESFLYLINHYWETKNKPTLSEKNRDLTNDKQEIEAIKNNAKLEIAQKFSSFLNEISNKKNLRTLESIGNFLGVSSERARILLEGKHKPQRATIAKISEKFEIPVEKILKEIQV